MGKISKRVYAISAVITALIFSAGIGAGWVLDSNRVSVLESELDEFKINFESLRIQENIFDVLNKTSCASYYGRFVFLAERTSDLSEKFNKFNAVTQFQKEKLENLKKTYTLTNLDLWLQTIRLRNSCGFNFTTVLYFYTLNSCVDCEAQGIVLDQLKRENPTRLMIFAVDSDLSLDVLRSLKESFGVTTLPYTVVNEVGLKPGFAKKEELEKIFGL